MPKSSRQILEFCLFFDQPDLCVIEASMMARFQAERLGSSIWFGYRSMSCGNISSTMVCDACGKEGARVRKITETYGKGEDLLVIENVPMISCPNCGENYFTSDTLHEIERIKIHRGSFAKERTVKVAEFA